MPTAPRKTVSTVDQAPLSIPFQTAAGAGPAAFGATEARALAGLSKGLENLGTDATKIAMQMRIEDNEREHKALELDYAKGINKILYGGDEGENIPAYLDTEGENAVTFATAAKDQARDLRTKLIQSATTKTVQDSFTNSSGVRMNMMFASIDQHTITQRDVAAKAQSDAIKESEAKDAAADPFNQKITSRALMVTLEAVTSDAEREGWSEEQTARELGEANSRILKDVIVAANSINPTGAAVLFEQYKGSIDGDLHAGLKNLLEDGTLIQTAQQETDVIWSLPISFAAKLDKARELEGKVRDQVVNRLERREAQRKVAETGEVDRARELLFGFMREDRGDGQQPPTTDEFAAQNPRAWRLLSAKDNASINAAFKIQDQSALGEQFARVTNSKVTLALSDLSAAQLAATNLEQLQQELTETDFNKWVDRRRVAIASIGKSGEETSSADRAAFSEFTTVIQDMGPAWLTENPDETPEERRRRNNFISDAYAVFLNARKPDGSLPNRFDQREIVGNLLKEFELSGAETETLPGGPFGQSFVGALISSLFDDDAEGIVAGVDLETLTPEQLARATVKPEDIRPSQVRVLQQEFNAIGVAPSEEQIGRLAFLKASGDDAGRLQFLKSSMTDEQFQALQTAIKANLDAQNIPVTPELLRALTSLQILGERDETIALIRRIKREARARGTQ